MDGEVKESNQFVNKFIYGRMSSNDKDKWKLTIGRLNLGY